MRLCNAAATLQLLINRIFYDCVDLFLVLFIDDLLIFSKDKHSHRKHLEIDLSRLKHNELFVLPKKCEFMRTEIKFLVLIIGRDALQVNPEKLIALSHGQGLRH